jgi:phosphohistidine phosphatase
MNGRRLVLIRHAKAEARASSDAARALAARGRRDARAVGRWLAAHGIEPDLVVVSPAQRTRQTWELAVSELGRTPPSAIDPGLYENSVDNVFDVIRAADPAISTLAIVGHNPSIEQSALALDDGGGPASREEMRRGFPTSGVAVLTVEVDWVDVGPATATLEDFAAPRG